MTALKKWLPCVALLLLCATMSWAQARFGVTAATQLTKISEKSFNSSLFEKPGVGFYVGATALFRAEKKLRIKTELLYSLEQAGSTSKLNQTWAMHYLRIPLALQCQLWKGLSVDAGFNTGIFLDTNILPGFFNPVDISMLLGLNYKFENNFQLGFRATSSLVDISDIEFTNEIGNPLDVDYKNLGLALNGAYFF